MGTTNLKANLLHQVIATRETVLHTIFLDIHKEYDALDRELCLYVQAGYGVGHRTIHILQTYWARTQMTAKAGGHYGPNFQSHHGVTQGDQLSPTIFKMVVDTVI